MMEIYLALLAR